MIVTSCYKDTVVFEELGSWNFYEVGNFLLFNTFSKFVSDHLT